MKKKKPEKKFTNFEFRSLTLSEREICSNRNMEFKNFFTQTLTWMRFGLVKLKGVEINEDNFDDEVNKLNDKQITDISLAIREATQFPDKKK